MAFEPTIVLSAVTFFFLPDTPLHARFLTEQEKAVCTSRGVRQVGQELSERIGVVNWKAFTILLFDPTVSADSPCANPIRRGWQYYRSISSKMTRLTHL